MDRFLWKNRVIVVDGDDDAAASLFSSLSRFEEEVSDRHLLAYLVDGTGSVRSFPLDAPPVVVSELGLLKARGSSFLLIGKDGGVKLSGVPNGGIKEVFELIDSMPMRQREMGNW